MIDDIINIMKIDMIGGGVPMKTKLILVFSMIAVLQAPLFAKRAAPPAVIPLENNEIKYVVNEPLTGYVSAIDMKSDTVLWATQAYKIINDFNHELDAQDVYINNLKKEKNILVITNEYGQIYKINLKTGKLLGLKGIIDFRKNSDKARLKLNKYAAIKIAWEKYVEITSQNSPEMCNKELYSFYTELKSSNWHVNIAMKAEDVVGGASFYISADTGEIEKESTY